MKNAEISQNKEENVKEVEILKKNEFSDKKNFQEIPENEALKSTIKEKFDLLFGKAEEERSEKEKGYCQVF